MSGEHLALQILGAGAGHHDAALPHGRGGVTYSTATASSTTGLVFGMVHTAVKPPWAAAAGGDVLPSAPGRIAEVHVHVHEAGGDDLPDRSRSTPSPW